MDGVGIEHEEGTVEGEADPDEDKVGPTVESLLEKHAPADVALYLEVAVLQWPDSKALAKALKAARG